ncbi:MAG: hypothetical protein IH946_07305 [Bacteroidetes bacterium]|nr:hypothetical protein [Bacteroidota bacterium]
MRIERTTDQLYAIANDHSGNNLFCKRYYGLAHWACDSLFGLVSIFDPLTPHDIMALQFLDTDTGFIVGQRHDAVYKSVDKGVTWQSMDLTAPYSYFHDVYFVNDQLGFVVGRSDAGGLFYTNDGANSWNLEQLSVNRDFRSIDFYDQQAAVVGDGTILLSNDQGTSWNIDTSTTSEMLNDVLFYDSNLVFIAGDSGLILRKGNTNGLIENKRLNHNMVLFPNPLHHSATLDLDPAFAMKDLKLHIYNPLGQQLREIGPIIDHKIVIERGNLVNGLYIYHLKSKGQLIGTGKMIVN